MLVLSRRTDEEIVLPSIGVRIRVLGVKGGRVSIGIDAPREIAIRRVDSESEADTATVAADSGILRKTDSAAASRRQPAV